jgi:hypothetical protein
MVRLEDPPDGSPAAADSIRGFHDEIRERLTTQRERFDKARDDFVAAAHTTAGADLGD